MAKKKTPKKKTAQKQARNNARRAGGRRGTKKPSSRRATSRSSPTSARLAELVRGSAGADSPEVDVAELERDLDVQRRLAEQERARRLRSYDGAVNVLAESTSASFVGKRGDTEVLPLRILAEGDSWFDFPFGGGLFQNGDVIAKLSQMIPYPILNNAVRGDEVRQMLGVRQRKRLEERLTDTKRLFNVLLFSGGGNDIVGDPFCLWLRSRESGTDDPADGIDETALAYALGVVRTGYEQLFDMRDAIIRAAPSRRIAIFIHSYDFAIPSGKGVCGHGPWMKPSLEYRGWTKASDAKAIVRDILSRFGAMLRDLASRRDDVHFVETQGVLGPRDWNDELHPKGAGFKKIAERFEESLRKAFPDSMP